MLGKGNKLFRTVVEKMQKLSRSVYLNAFQSGKIILSIEKENVNVKTYFTNLISRYDGNILVYERDNENTACIQLDVRKLSCILQYQSFIQWHNAIARM